MKVNGTGGIGGSAGPKPARAGAGEGFRLPQAGTTAAPGQSASVAGATTLVGVDALIALQDVGGPLERRRRSVRRAVAILDVLDDVKAALLAGELSSQDLLRLQRAVRAQREATDDPRLEGVLDEIETRAEVEIAKLEMARAA